MQTEENQDNFDIKEYRQALVTAMGFKLGFLISLLGGWSAEVGFKLDQLDNKILFCGSFFGVFAMLVALLMLLIPTPKKSMDRARYIKILWIYGTGTALSLGSIVISGFIFR